MEQMSARRTSMMTQHILQLLNMEPETFKPSWRIICCQFLEEKIETGILGTFQFTVTDLNKYIATLSTSILEGENQQRQTEYLFVSNLMSFQRSGLDNFKFSNKVLTHNRKSIHTKGAKKSDYWPEGSCFLAHSHTFWQVLYISNSDHPLFQIKSIKWGWYDSRNFIFQFHLIQKSCFNIYLKVINRDYEWGL